MAATHEEVWFWPGSEPGPVKATMVVFHSSDEEHERLPSASVYRLEKQELVQELKGELEQMGPPLMKMTLSW